MSHNRGYRNRIVIDTNVYLSRFLRPTSVPGRAVERALETDIPLLSAVILSELRDVLTRPKFARYVDLNEAEPFLLRIIDAAQQIDGHTRIEACHDPRDNKFLELAVDGHADLILSGDQDLLVLRTFRGIPIVNPTQYLAED